MKGVDDKPYALDQATLIRKIAEEEQAYQAANERAQKLWLELYGDDGLKNLMAAYLAAWGGSIPKLWMDAFAALGVEPMDDIQAAFDLAQRLAPDPRESKG